MTARHDRRLRIDQLDDELCALDESPSIETLCFACPALGSIATNLLRDGAWTYPDVRQVLREQREQAWADLVKEPGVLHKYSYENTQKLHLVNTPNGPEWREAIPATVREPGVMRGFPEPCLTGNKTIENAAAARDCARKAYAAISERTAIPATLEDRE